MKVNKIIGFLILGIIVFAFWYYCIDTLTLSEVIGKDASSEVSIFINLFNSDTELTRYDFYNLKSKTRNWEKRLQEVDSIRDSARRDREYEKVVAEMMADPSMKKIIKKVSGFGKGAVMTVLEVINTF